MSSVRQLERQSVESPDDADMEAWVVRRSPKTERASVSANDVLAAIGAARLAYRRGATTSTTYADLPAFGGGDVEVARDVETAIADRWDS